MTTIWSSDRGPHYDRLDADTAKVVNQMLDYKDELRLGTYNPNFGKAWNQIQALEKRHHRRIGLVEAAAAGNGQQGAAPRRRSSVVHGRGVHLLRRRIVASLRCSELSAAWCRL